MHALCECQSAGDPFCFHQHGFKNHISLVWTHGEIYINIHKADAVLCNNSTRSEQQQSSRSEKRKRFSSENV